MAKAGALPGSQESWTALLSAPIVRFLPAAPPVVRVAVGMAVTAGPVVLVGAGGLVGPEIDVGVGGGPNVPVAVKTRFPPPGRTGSGNCITSMEYVVPCVTVKVSCESRIPGPMSSLQSTRLRLPRAPVHTDNTVS